MLSTKQPTVYVLLPHCYSTSSTALTLLTAVAEASHDLVRLHGPYIKRWSHGLWFVHSFVLSNNHHLFLHLLALKIRAYLFSWACLVALCEPLDRKQLIFFRMETVSCFGLANRVIRIGTPWLVNSLFLCHCCAVYAPLLRLQLRNADADRTLNDLKGGVTLVKHTVGSSFRMSKVCVQRVCASFCTKFIRTQVFIFL